MVVSKALIEAAELRSNLKSASPLFRLPIDASGNLPRLANLWDNSEA
jgi:hypothetical protein